ncbi:multicopper oxidase domain-containing protein [Alicyclobacillus sp.]|uniref:multicopper oxidase domain-containing protein n=1 Tax=Alicyclobacillus sp. TaxID=61169 RepID=UPI0025B90375|nr:multicopper oxidase domain-containing protein [Alicyclobacillus sp.]MCL6517098.1 multicopper oxidase domain-containing protein [Alicyclobacillus sp.]
MVNLGKWQVFSLAIAAVAVLAGCGGGAGQTTSNTVQATTMPAGMAVQNQANQGGGTQTAAPNQAPVPMRVSRDGNRVTIDMTAQQTDVQIASGVTYHAWTFDGTVPGPVITLQQGDEVTLNLHNLDTTMPHSIDLHAALVAPDKTFVEVMPGETKTVHFTANLPGVYMYHCATPPMLLHIGNGMYGAIVVVPKGQPAPTYTIVQSEFYQNGDYNQMLNGKPEYVVFNGKANQYLDHPLTAKVGQPVYIAFVNAGPNLFSAFHIVGTVLSDVMPSGSVNTHLYNLQTYTVAPGDGALFKVTFDQPGTYSMVTHAMADASKGAMGKIVVTP